MTQETGGKERLNAPGKGAGARIRRYAFAFVIAAMVVYAALALIFHTWNPFTFTREPAPSFDGDSSRLTSTQIVPTLDTPIENGKNVIWCATFAAGWKQLQQTVTKGPVNLTDAAEVCARLNAAPDPAPTMPAEAFYAKAGAVEKGVVQAIRREMQAKFPSHTLSELENPEVADGLLFYSYLEAHVPFTLHYIDNPSALEFTGSDGAKTPIRSFGFRREDAALYRLKKQPFVLMVRWQEKPDKPYGNVRPESFAIDLCKDSKVYQIVAARVTRKETLAATLNALEQDIRATAAMESQEGVLESALQVPDISWRVSHHYRELEGHPFENPELQGQRVTLARQDIELRLDKTGARVKSISLKGATTSASPAGRESIYLFDGPFLLYIKMRGAATPFFVMWVDNAELLQRWAA